MSKSKARFLGELLSSDGKVVKSKSEASTIVVGDLPTIPNSKLQNSSVTIAGEGLSLGASLTLDTGDVTEHTNYKYYTDGRVDARITNAGSGNWNTAYGWGNHASAGYITSDTNTHTHLDTTDNRTISASEFAAGDLHFGFTSWANNNTSPYADFIHMRSYADSSGGNENLLMFKKSGKGIRLWQSSFGSSSAYSSYVDIWDTGTLTTTNKANYDTAYGWGNHASAGYVTSSGNTIIGTDTDLSFAGANVLASIALTDGVITAYANRVLTLANLGYTGETNATADQSAAEIRAAVEAASDSNVFTDADHTKLGGIAASANNYVLPSGIATESYVNSEITTLIGGAPSTLNDLNELAAAINDDANYNSTLTTALATKLPKSGGTMTGTLAMGANAITSTGTITGASYKVGSQTVITTSKDLVIGTQINFNNATNSSFIGAASTANLRYAADGIHYFDTYNGGWGTRAQIGDNYLNLGANVAFQINGTTVIDTSRNITMGSTLTVAADGATNYTSNHIRFMSHNTARGAGHFMMDDAGANTWYTGTAYADAFNNWGVHYKAANEDEETAHTQRRVLTVGKTGNLTAAGVISATGGNSGNWNTAYTVANAALPKAGGTMTGAITAPSFSGAVYGAASGAPDSTIWGISRDSYPTYGIFYDEGNPDKILYKWNGVTKFNINMETGALDTPSTITATGGNSGNWNTAYGWGNHASGGYLTSSSTQSKYLRSDIADSGGITTSSSLNIPYLKTTMLLVGATNFADTVNGAPWYGLGKSTLVGYHSNNATMSQLANYWGLRLQTATARIDMTPTGYQGNILFGAGTSVSGTTWARINSTGLYQGLSNLVWHAGNDGAGSTLDADLLDGQQGSVYGRVNGGTSGNMELAATSTSTSYSVAAVELRESNYQGNASATPPHLGFHWGGVVASSITIDSAGAIQIRNNPGTAYENFRANNIYANGTNLVWHTGNDGSGSGLDADLLDGQHGSYYQPAGSYLTAETNAFIGDGGSGDTHPGTGRAIYTGQLSAGSAVFGMPTNDNSNSILTLNRHSGNYNSQLGFSSLGSMYYRSFSNVAINNSTTWRKVWDAGNDGSGSGLDADLLDGQHGSYYANESARKSVPSSGNYQITNSTAPATLGQGYLRHDFLNSSGPPGSSYRSVLSISSYTGGSQWTQLSFNYNQGINTPIYFRQNQYNGSTWSSWHQLWDSANDGSGSGLDADLLDGQHASAFATSAQGTLATNALPKAGGTLTGNLNLSGSGNHIIIGGSAGSNHYDTVASTTGLTFGGGNDFANYSIGTTTENVGGNYTKLNIKWHTGIRFFAKTNYGGVRFHSDVGMGTEILSIGNGDGHVRVANNLLVGGTVDGRDVAADGSKLDGIAAGANNITNNNQLTNGAGYTNDQTAAEIQALVKTRFYNNAALSSSGTTSAFIAELIADYGCFNDGQVTLKVQWSYAGSSDLVTGHATIGTIELAGCTIETWGGTYKHVRITRPNTGAGGHGVYEYNDQSSSYAPGWREIWTSESDGAGSGLDADKLDGQEGSYYYAASNPSGYTNNTVANAALPKSGGTMTGAITTNGHNIIVNTDTGMSTTGAWIRNTTAHGYIALGPANTSHAHIYTDRSNFYFNVNTLYQNGNLIWGANNDGSGSGLDADLLDGQQGSYYYAASNPSGYITASGNAATSHAVTGSAFATTSSPGSVLEYQQASGQTDTKLAPSGDWHNTIRMGHGNPYSYYSNSIAARMTGSGYGDLYTQSIYNSTAQGWRKLWSTGNDGSGSGLDADLLDGLDSGAFARLGGVDHLRSIPSRWFATADADNTIDFYSHNYAKAHMGNTYKYTTSRPAITTDSNYWTGSIGWGAINLNTIMSYGSGFVDVWSMTDALNRPSNYTTHWNGFSSMHYSASTTSQHGMQMMMGVGDPSHTYLRGQWGASVRAWQKIWTTGNDGSGSGLDADLLDGEQGSNYARQGNIGYQQASDLFTFPSYNDGNSTSGDQASLQIYQGNAGEDAFLQFHVSGDYAGFFGLDGTTNDLFWGGWSVGNNKHKIWHAGNDGSGSGLDADYVDGVEASSFIRSDAADTFTGTLTMGTQIALAPSNYGRGLFGLYSSYRYQHVWAMGSAYKTSDDGTSYGNMYGLTYTHTNVGTGTNQSISGLSHQLQHRHNGTLTAAIGSGIWTSGNVTAYSDIAVKTNLVRIPNALEKVCSINGYTYERTDYVKDLEDPEAPDILRQAGVVAQEIEKVLPEVVSGNDGNKAVAYGNIVALLIESIKELKDEVDELKKQLREK